MIAEVVVAINQRLITGSIQGKITLILLVMFALLAITVILNFSTFSSLDGSAPAINQSGAQRMRLFKMATLAGTVERELGAARAAAVEELEATMAQFEAVQAGLVNGDDNFSLTGTSNQGIIAQVDVVNGLWESYEAELQTVLDSSTLAREALLDVNGDVANLFAAAAASVGAHVNAGAPGAAVDAAGAQRMRAYKLAFLANDYSSATGEMRDSLAAELNTTINQFAAAQAGLRSGDASLGLNGTQDQQVIAALDVVDQRWNSFRSELQVVLSGDANAALAVAELGRLAPEVFAESNRAVTLIEEDASGVVSSLKTLEIVLIVVSVLVLFAMIWFVRRYIVQPLIAVKGTAQDLSSVALPAMTESLTALAAADMTKKLDINLNKVDVKSSDEIGQIGEAFNEISDRIDESVGAYNKVVDDLRVVISDVRNTAGDLSNASTQMSDAAEQSGQATQGIASTAQQLATGAQKQAESVQDAVRQVDELNDAVARVKDGSSRQSQGVESAQDIVQQVARAIDGVAENAQTATSGAAKANTSAENGLSVVRQTVDGMQKINEAVQMVSTQVSELGDQSTEIGKIVSVIDDIAAQTNLLALNAAIEAARAGEQGRGFAVVADEVRQLAERVTQATTEIAGLIDNVQKGVEDSVRATEAGTDQVAQGTELADSSGKALEEIIAAVSEVSQQIEQISAAAEQVSASSEEMVTNIDSVNKIASENTETAEGMANSASLAKDSMNNVAAITEQTSAAAEESSASTEQLSAQVEEVVASSQSLNNMATELNQAVSVFKFEPESEESSYEAEEPAEQPAQYSESTGDEEQSAA